MLRTTTRPRTSAVALAALLTATVAGCSAEEGAESATSGGGGITVQTAQFSWTAAGLTNSILSEIAADHPDLGVASLATTQLDPAAAWASRSTPRRRARAASSSSPTSSWPAAWPSCSRPSATS